MIRSCSNELVASNLSIDLLMEWEIGRQLPWNKKLSCTLATNDGGNHTQQKVLFFPPFSLFLLSSDFVPIRMLLRNKELQFTFSLGSKEMAINLNKFVSIFVSIHRCPLSVIRCCFLYVASFHAFCLYKYKNAKAIKHVSLFFFSRSSFQLFLDCVGHIHCLCLCLVFLRITMCSSVCGWAGEQTGRGVNTDHRCFSNQVFVFVHARS